MARTLLLVLLALLGPLSLLLLSYGPVYKSLIHPLLWDDPNPWGPDLWVSMYRHTVSVLVICTPLAVAGAIIPFFVRPRRRLHALPVALNGLVFGFILVVGIVFLLP